MVDSVKGRRIRGCLSSRQGLFDSESAVSVVWSGLKLDWWGSSRLFCEKKAESLFEAARSSFLEINGRSDTGQ